ncbi:MAG: PTS sugar transporter subunit IIA [Deltaproteobacteria bacterium]|nr:PTS sugar transporter subunit IIA [Deltaproteobacteria bacterium]
MVGAVIITHGDISRSLCEAAEAITGKADMIKTISVKSSNATEDIRNTLASSVKEADSGFGVIIFTDMFGGTPTNIALSLLEEGRVEVITGVNLPMLLKFIGHRAEKEIGELAVFLREYGRNSVILAGEMLKEKK